MLTIEPGRVFYDELGLFSQGHPTTYAVLALQRRGESKDLELWSCAVYPKLGPGFAGASVRTMCSLDLLKLECLGELNRSGSTVRYADDRTRWREMLYDAASLINQYKSETPASDRHPSLTYQSDQWLQKYVEEWS